jgi:hypothetical protein
MYNNTSIIQLPIPVAKGRCPHGFRKGAQLHLASCDQAWGHWAGFAQVETKVF